MKRPLQTAGVIVAGAATDLAANLRKMENGAEASESARRWKVTKPTACFTILTWQGRAGRAQADSESLVVIGTPPP